jgi:RimJ/RimL family protein N-acetyltransferase
MRVLHTLRLCLEPQVAAHADEMFRVLSDPAIYEDENEPPRSLAWLRERFAKLESRRSADGTEHWLNWVIRLQQDSEFIGYVQATVRPDGAAAIAYELGSSFWGQGFASEAVRAMVAELGAEYRARSLHAVLKQRNLRSRRLLERLGFAVATPRQHLEARVDPDELLMLRDAAANASDAT